MSFDYADALPVPTSWFDPEPAYSGWAKARFADLPATIEGPASAIVNEVGSVDVELKIHVTRPSILDAEVYLDSGQLVRILAAIPRAKWRGKLGLSLGDLVFRILCYEGTYDSVTLPYKNVLMVDWVGPETPASKLGYVAERAQ